MVITPVKPAATSLELIEESLTSIVAAIRQESEDRSRIFINAVVGKTVGLGSAAGIAGLISTFGAASTGTAIASLSGAAATTAQLYWVGSIIGLGVAAGGVVLASTGVGIGLAASIVAKRQLFGRRRGEVDFQDYEKAILAACMTMIKALREQTKTGRQPSAKEMQIISEQVFLPLTEQISQYWSLESLKAEGISGCRPFTQNLAYLPRRKLNRARTQIEQLARLMQEPSTGT